MSDKESVEELKTILKNLNLKIEKLENDSKKDGIEEIKSTIRARSERSDYIHISNIFRSNIKEVKEVADKQITSAINIILENLKEFMNELTHEELIELHYKIYVCYISHNCYPIKKDDETYLEYKLIKVDYFLKEISSIMNEINPKKIKELKDKICEIIEIYLIKHKTCFNFSNMIKNNYKDNVKFDEFGDKILKLQKEDKNKHLEELIKDLNIEELKGLKATL
jgi:hypothetical protein